LVVPCSCFVFVGLPYRSGRVWSRRGATTATVHSRSPARSHLLMKQASLAPLTGRPTGLQQASIGNAPNNLEIQSNIRHCPVCASNQHYLPCTLTATLLI